MERQVAEPDAAIATREVVALAAVAWCSVVAWHSLVGLVARGRVYLSAQAPLHDTLLPLFWLVVSCMVAIYIIRKAGLLALARRQAAVQATGSDWWRWLAHFKLSLAALSVTCVAAWLKRLELMSWLAWDPDPSEWPPRAQLFFNSPAELVRAEVTIVVATTWIVALPFLASDAWGLLLPRSNPRVARLRVSFAVATGLVALGVLALVREWARGMFGVITSFDGAI